MNFDVMTENQMFKLAVTERVKAADSLKFMKSFVKTDNIYLLFEAGETFLDHLYSSEIAERIIYLLSTVKYSELSLEATIPSKIGERWPDDRYDDRFLDIILKDNHNRNLLAAGETWPDHRYDERISQRLIDMEDKWGVLRAFTYWPPHRCNSNMVSYIIDNGTWSELCGIIDADISSIDCARGEIVNKIFTSFNADDASLGSCQLLYYAWLRSNDNKTSDYVANLFLKSGMTQLLYEMGRKCSDKVFSPSIGHCLYMSRKRDLIDMAQKTWCESRIKYITRPKIVVDY